MIDIGSRVPNATLYEYNEVESEGCSLGPIALSVTDNVAGRKILVFGLPGAFTRTCSAKHVPGYVAQAEALRAAGIDEVWCVSVNDAYVMGAWGREQGVAGKVRMMGDGSALWTGALGLTQDLIARGMGIRAQRFAMVIDDGVVTHLQVEAPGEFRVSSAEAMLDALRG